MTTKSKSIWAIIIGIALIAMSIYTINTYSKNSSATTFSKIMVDIFALLFILMGSGAIWISVSQLKSAQ
ncbi:MAG: hypothetical protein IT243_06045 [Bacteroidia bacterium]|nr:hypothetical protein [Bacteroidia bacterium]